MKTDWARLFTSFNGRISRRDWWIGTLALLALEFAGYAVIDPAMFDWTSEATPPAGLGVTLWSLALAIPNIALAIKRFADLNWARWLSLVVWLPMIGFIVGDYMGYLDLDVPSDWEAVQVGLIFTVVGCAIALIVTCGLIPGTRGPNRYGPDPREPIKGPTTP